MKSKFTLGNCIVLCACAAVVLWNIAVWTACLTAPETVWSALSEAEKSNVYVNLELSTMLMVLAAGWLVWWFKNPPSDD